MIGAVPLVASLLCSSIALVSFQAPARPVTRQLFGQGGYVPTSINPIQEDPPVCCFYGDDLFTKRVLVKLLDRNKSSLEISTLGVVACATVSRSVTQRSIKAVRESKSLFSFIVTSDKREKLPEARFGISFRKCEQRALASDFLIGMYLKSHYHSGQWSVWKSRRSFLTKSGTRLLGIDYIIKHNEENSVTYDWVQSDDYQPAFPVSTFYSKPQALHQDIF